MRVLNMNGAPRRRVNIVGVGIQEAMSMGDVPSADITNILFERVIGETRDLLQIEFFGRGIVDRAARESHSNRCRRDQP